MGTEEILYSMSRDIEKMLSVTVEMYNEKQEKYSPPLVLKKYFSETYDSDFPGEVGGISP